MSLIALAGDYVLGKVADGFLKSFKSAVIDRWSRSRAEQFVATFCEAVAEGKDDETVQAQLESVLADDLRSQALFDAYRRVALSASPILGPRIIALITARVVGEDRRPSASEERLLMAAEQLSDEEFVETKAWFDRYVHKLELRGSVYFDPGRSDDAGGIDYWDGWGSWAAKLAHFGIISHSIRIRPLRMCDEEGREIGHDIEDVKLATEMYYSREYKELVELTVRAGQMAPG